MTLKKHTKLCPARPRLVAVGLLAFLAALPALPAGACLNDRDSDSLASEGGKLPQVVSVITGRFERNPPLFYQMRLARVRREIAAHPTDWKRYDDAAVACDRLHDDTSALRWIEQKRTGMERAHVTPATLEGRDAWYRYHANAGTFHAHRFLQNGAKPEQLGEMDQGIRHIEKALALNPNAHFGRERYQLAAMRWIAKVKRGKADLDNLRMDGILPEVARISGKTSDASLAPEQRAAENRQAIEGLSGLIVLGNAWESVDVFAALSRTLLSTEDKKVGYLALLRSEELLQSQHSSFNTHITKASVPQPEKAAKLAEYSSLWHGVTNEQNLRVKYAELRAAADQWQAARTSYLLARLKAGQHPDTTPDFWNSFTPPAEPSLTIAWRDEAGGNLRNWLMRNQALTGFLMLSLLIGGCIAVWHTLRFCLAHLPWNVRPSNRLPPAPKR